jgi:hypothetical protein
MTTNSQFHLPVTLRQPQKNRKIHNTSSNACHLVVYFCTFSPLSHARISLKLSKISLFFRREREKIERRETQKKTTSGLCAKKKTKCRTILCGHFSALDEIAGRIWKEFEVFSRFQVVVKVV